MTTDARQGCDSAQESAPEEWMRQAAEEIYRESSAGSNDFRERWAEIIRKHAKKGK